MSGGEIIQSFYPKPKNENYDLSFNAKYSSKEIEFINAKIK